MKRLLFVIILLQCMLSVNALPVHPNAKKIVKMADGSVLELKLKGDEHCHWWVSDNGQTYTFDDNDNIMPLNSSNLVSMKSKAMEKKRSINTARLSRLNKARKVGEPGKYVGDKKGLVILVNFKNLEMLKPAPEAEFYNLFNKEGYRNFGHIGSVHDYFKDQSYGQFNLTFDIFGPVTVSQNYAYYGKNDFYGDDQHPAELVIEACRLVDDQVDFSEYDWDGDGEVDQVFVVYAGFGENAGASSLTLWPHEFTLSDSHKYGDGEGAINLDGVRIDTYAVSCELAGAFGTTINGIGTACHEFSHCLGLPDFYDTSYSGGWGMNNWDLMDSGSYNGPTYSGEIPSGYTSYERWMAGWLEPKELLPGMKVEALNPLVNTADAYIIYNDNNHNEYYMLENRTNDRWFKYLQSRSGLQNGMLVLHVDYNQSYWDNNTVNAMLNHQRMTIIPANNLLPSEPTVSSYRETLYPNNNNDSLTNTSTPAATLFNANTDGKKLMNKGIINIKRNADNTISFECNYFNPGVTPEKDPDPALDGEVLFYESFNQCLGTGGNDNRWNGNIATSAFVPDNAGWEASYSYGANGCARFGTGSIVGAVTSPTIELEGDGVLEFKAAPWVSPSESRELTVFVNDEPAEVVTLIDSQWTTYRIEICGTGNVKVKFVPNKRFFLDEVKVVKKETDGIKSLELKGNDCIYNVTGQYMGTNPYSLKSGLYIVNGKKVLIKN